MNDSDEVPEIIREAEAILSASANDPGAERIRGHVAQGCSYIAISGFDLDVEHEKRHAARAINILITASRHNPAHSFFRTTKTSYFLLFTPSMDPGEAASKLSIIRDAIVEAYPGGDAPAIGMHLPPPA